METHFAFRLALDKAVPCEQSPIVRMPGRRERFCSAKGGYMTKVVAAAIVAPACGTVASAQEFAWISERIAEPTDLRRAREQELEETRVRVREAERAHGRATAARAGCKRGTASMKPDVAVRRVGSGRCRPLPPKNRTCQFPRVRLEPLAKAHVVLGK